MYVCSGNLLVLICQTYRKLARVIQETPWVNLFTRTHHLLTFCPICFVVQARVCLFPQRHWRVSWRHHALSPLQNFNVR